MSAMLLAQALVSENPVPRLWLVTRGAQQADALECKLSPAQAPVWGLGKALAIEHPELRCVCVDLDPEARVADLDALAAELNEPGRKSEVAFRGGGRRVARLARLRMDAPLRTKARSERPGDWSPASPGTLERFRREPSIVALPRPGEVEIAVEATGVNFKDVLSVLGLYPGDPGPLGRRMRRSRLGGRRRCDPCAAWRRRLGGCQRQLRVPCRDAGGAGAAPPGRVERRGGGFVPDRFPHRRVLSFSLWPACARAIVCSFTRRPAASAWLP